MTIVWRRLAVREIDHEQLWLAVAGAALFCLTLTTVGLVDIQLPRCLFKLMTGLPCPTCGLTRAIMAIARFDLGAAFAVNPLAVAAAAIALVYVIYAAVVLAGRLPRLRPRLAPRDLRTARLLGVAALAVNWLYLVMAGR